MKKALCSITANISPLRLQVLSHLRFRNMVQGHLKS